MCIFQKPEKLGKISRFYLQQYWWVIVASPDITVKASIKIWSLNINGHLKNVAQNLPGPQYSIDNLEIIPYEESWFNHCCEHLSEDLFISSAVGSMWKLSYYWGKISMIHLVHWILWEFTVCPGFWHSVNGIRGRLNWKITESRDYGEEWSPSFFCLLERLRTGREWTAGPFLEWKAAFLLDYSAFPPPS